MSRFFDGFWILLVISLIVQHFGYRRRLAEKDRRIAELEHLLNGYRDHPAEVIDADDIRELLPHPGEEAEGGAGVDLKIDV